MLLSYCTCVYVICICICTLFCLFVLCIHQRQHAYTSIMHASTTHIHFNDRYNTAAWLTFGTVQYCHWYQQFFVDTRNHHCLSRVSGLSTTLLPDQFLILSSSHYCWGTGFGAITVTGPGLGAILLPRPIYLSTGLTQNCVGPH